MTSPRGFGLPHLSEDAVAAFADGVLSAAAASRARRHCSECPECADAVRVQREAAMMLRAAQAPALPSGLLDRLAGLPMSTPLPQRHTLPTVLGADGVPMFLAHDARGVDGAEQGKPSGEPGLPGQPQQGGRPGPRRGAVPVTVLASAAAVVAAGTFGGHVSTLAADSSLRAPAGAANAAGALGGSQPTGARPASPLTGTGLLSVGRLTTSPAVTERAWTSTPGSGSQPAASATVAPVLRTARRSTGPAMTRASSAASSAGFWGATRWAAANQAGPAAPTAADRKGTETGKSTETGKAGSSRPVASASGGPAPAARTHGPSTATP
jgi:hypothetical protein